MEGRTKRAIRSAESSRQSSCKFADEIARLCISEFKLRCPSDLNFKQTVVAGFVVEDNQTQVMFVASIGVGTKFLCRDKSESAFQQLSRVYDCHAEVIARRSFMCFLYEELEKALTGYSSILESVNDRMRLKSHVKIHMYSSSQPCGNATIKKWGSCKKAVHYPDLSICEYPLETHARITISSRHQGQVALLLKKGTRTANSHKKEAEGKSEVLHKRDSTLEVDDQQKHNTFIPPGTASLESCAGSIMTCSDKMAKWNAVGLQGGFLVQFIEPIYLTTITIGRKYSKLHGERAVCCRLQDFRPNEVFRIHHPTLLCTSVKLDESVIVTGLASARLVAVEVEGDSVFTGGKGGGGKIDGEDGEYRHEEVVGGKRSLDAETGDEAKGGHVSMSLPIHLCEECRCSPTNVDCSQPQLRPGNDDHIQLCVGAVFDEIRSLYWHRGMDGGPLGLGHVIDGRTGHLHLSPPGGREVGDLSPCVVALGGNDSCKYPLISSLMLFRKYHSILDMLGEGGKKENALNASVSQNGHCRICAVKCGEDLSACEEIPSLYKCTCNELGRLYVAHKARGFGCEYEAAKNALLGDWRFFEGWARRQLPT